MNQKYKVAGYVKLAKLWERSAEKAIAYHRAYYKEKYEDSDRFVLFDVYVDITGQKEISRRPAMLRVIRDCMRGDSLCQRIQICQKCIGLYHQGKAAKNHESLSSSGCLF